MCFVRVCFFLLLLCSTFFFFYCLSFFLCLLQLLLVYVMFTTSLLLNVLLFALVCLFRAIFVFVFTIYAFSCSSWRFYQHSFYFILRFFFQHFSNIYTQPSYHAHREMNWTKQSQRQQQQQQQNDNGNGNNINTINRVKSYTQPNTYLLRRQEPPPNTRSCSNHSANLYINEWGRNVNAHFFLLYSSDFRFTIQIATTGWHIGWPIWIRNDETTLATQFLYFSYA